jgi:hypothetical protein
VVVVSRAMSNQIDPLAAGASVIAAAFGAAGVWLAQRVMGKAAFQTAINSGFSTLLEQVQADRRELKAELAMQRHECAMELNQLRGELNNSRQIVASLTELLQKAGLIALPTHAPTGDLTDIHEVPKSEP